MYNADFKLDTVQNDTPRPCGYKLLIAIPAVEERTAGGIIRPDNLRTQEQTASVIGYVVELGPDAYSDHDKFPTGPFCKQGDWVVFRSYSGTRIKRKGQEFRLINDDTVEAVIDDPREFERA